MEANSTLGEEETLNNNRNSSAKFTFVKDSLKYILLFKNKLQTIDFNVRRVLGTSTYEGKFTFEDLKSTAQVFGIYKNLDEIYEDLKQKLTDQDLFFNEEDDRFSLKFEFIYENRKMEACLHLYKTKDVDLHNIVDEMCKVLLENSENTKELQQNIFKHEEKFKKQEELLKNFKCEKNENFEVNITKHKDKIVNLDESVTKHEKTLIEQEKIIKSLQETIKKHQEIISSLQINHSKNEICLKSLEKTDLSGIDSSKIIINVILSILKSG